MVNLSIRPTTPRHAHQPEVTIPQAIHPLLRLSPDLSPAANRLFPRKSFGYTSPAVIRQRTEATGYSDTSINDPHGMDGP